MVYAMRNQVFESSSEWAKLDHNNIIKHTK